MTKCGGSEKEWDTWAQNIVEVPQAKVWGVKLLAPLTDTMGFIHADLINSLQELLIKPQMHEMRIDWQLRGQYDGMKHQWMDLLCLIIQRITFLSNRWLTFIKFGLSPRASAVTDTACQPYCADSLASWIPSDFSGVMIMVRPFSLIIGRQKVIVLPELVAEIETKLFLASNSAMSLCQWQAHIWKCFSCSSLCAVIAALVTIGPVDFLRVRMGHVLQPSINVCSWVPKRHMVYYSIHQALLKPSGVKS